MTSTPAPAVLVSGVVLSQPAGGVRRHNRELLPRLAGLLEDAGGRLALLEGARGLPFDLPPNVERHGSKTPDRPAPRRALAEGRALRQVLQAAAAQGRPFDLVHTAHHPVPRTLPLPYTVTQHDLRQLELIDTPFARRLFARGILGRALRGAAGVFAVSEAVRREILLRFGLPAERVRVLPNAADHFEPLPRRVEEGAEMLAVGHVEPRKNLELLLHALAADEGLPDLRIAGRAKGNEEERLRARARELGVEPRVRFTGPFEDAELPQLYARAACVALPSRLEGFGIVALEAQRARVPLAVARTDALVEVAGTEVPSFAPADAAECARALRAALDLNPEELDALARAAERFTWDRSARAWFEGLCAAARVSPPGAG